MCGYAPRLDGIQAGSQANVDGAPKYNDVLIFRNCYNLIRDPIQYFLHHRGAASACCGFYADVGALRIFE